MALKWGHEWVKNIEDGRGGKHLIILYKCHTTLLLLAFYCNFDYRWWWISVETLPSVQAVYDHISYCSGYLKARHHLQAGSYGEIVECCQNELANPLTPHKVEALLLRATMYQLRGESARAMDDLTALINMEDCPLKVKENALYFNAVCFHCTLKLYLYEIDYTNFIHLRHKWKQNFRVQKSSHTVIIFLSAVYV